MELHKRDRALQLLEEQLKKEEEFEMKNLKDGISKKSVKDFASSIQSDYNSDYNKLMESKKRQVEHLMKLYKYIDDKINTNVVSDTRLKQLKLERKRVLNELDRLESYIEDNIVE